MPAESQPIDWETDLTALLDELSSVQTEMLDVLAAKRDSMASSDIQNMTELHPRAEALCDRLRSCHQRREDLLAAAKVQGLPAENLGSIASTLATSQRGRVTRQMTTASARMRLLQHQSLANWVLAQRTILHLSQLLEIIATGGRLQPTYSRDEPSDSRGALVDKEV
ncbi:MAG: flagellar export chaperone FlgN [Pirellulaceae bacterium]